MAKLSKECSDRFSLFQEVINCKEYTAKSITKEGSLHTYIWRNTNKLLEKGFCGIKTGITDHAGPCLAAEYRKIEADAIKVNPLRFHFQSTT